MNSKIGLTEIAVGLSGNEWDTETIYAIRALLAKLHEHEMDIDPEWFGYLELIRNLINALKNEYGD